MWSWVANIFGSPGRVIDEVHSVGSFLGDQYDKSKFTPQEIAEDYQKRRDNWLEMQKLMANQNSLSSVTRRIISYSIIIPYMMLIVLCAMIFKIDPDWSREIFRIVDATFWIPMSVIGFYFGPHEFQKLNVFKGKG